ncbi:zinc dependent phospholipase C family protein [uncultured Shewanella sp.]|uniref:zinc dependent phospholipase C family protein n=1 Tax=uncultured Shewanella sp. TaxID=173975 RepID=UPI0026044977|nr:zinc dependent phospholipase C family protein [uncultured Shewanella sp.]
MLYRVKVVLGLLLLSLSLSAQAYKIQSHVWIGQQIINDLESDGKLSIELDGKIIQLSVPSDVKQAILSYQDAFLMGHIGPDAAPDILVGQSLIHPGENGWNTAEWLNYLLNEVNSPNTNNKTLMTAYSYGFLGHASSDVFAHTYVNKYAGDIFSLTDETLVETRHIALEGYIADKTPAIRNNAGQTWPSAYHRVNIENDYANNVRDTLIYNDTTQVLYQQSTYAKHLAAYWQYRQVIDDLAEAGIWHEIDKWVTQIAAQYWLNIDLSDAEAGAIVDAVQPVLDILNGPVTDELQAASNKMYAISNKFETLQVDGMEKINDEAKTLQRDLLNTKQKLETTLLEIDSHFRGKSCERLDDATQWDPTGLSEWISNHSIGVSILRGLFGRERKRPSTETHRINGTHNDFKTAKTELIKNIEFNRKKIPTFACRDGDSICFNKRANVQHDLDIDRNMLKLVELELLLWPDIKTVEKEECWVEDTLPPTQKCRITRVPYTSSVVYSTGQGTHPNVNDAAGSTAIGKLCYDVNDTINDQLIDIVNVKYSLENELLENHIAYTEKVIELKKEMIAASESVNNVANAFVDLNQVISLDVSPIQGLLRSWRGDLDSAMSAYVKANGQVMLNSTYTGAETIEPLETWFKCYHAQLLGIPSAVGNACNAGLLSSIRELIDAMKNIVEIINTLASPPGVSSSVKAKVEELSNNIIEDLTNELKQQVGDELRDLVPENVQLLLDVSSEKINDSRLNHYFSVPETQSSKGILMLPDMAQRIKADMQLNTTGKFDPNQFSVVFNSLQLAKLALLDTNGLSVLATQAGLPSNSFSGTHNIMASAFANIDGNHQWMPIAPPLPNSHDVYNQSLNSYSTNIGFVPWRENNRDKLFNGLFKGPLTPNLDSMFSGNHIAGSNYPYQVCMANPFPANLQDRKCLAIILIPILTGMLH